MAGTFPSEWIRRKQRDGFYVTVMGCIGPPTAYHWVVVVTSGTGFSGQAVELDFVYPSEAIHHYWDEGALACSPPDSSTRTARLPGLAAPGPSCWPESRERHWLWWPGRGKDRIYLVHQYWNKGIVLSPCWSGPGLLTVCCECPLLASVASLQA